MNPTGVETQIIQQICPLRLSGFPVRSLCGKVRGDDVVRSTPLLHSGRRSFKYRIPEGVSIFIRSCSINDLNVINQILAIKLTLVLNIARKTAYCKLGEVQKQGKGLRQFQNSSKLSKRPLLRSDKVSVFPPSHKATAGQARQQVQTTLYSSLRMASKAIF